MNTDIREKNVKSSAKKHKEAKVLGGLCPFMYVMTGINLTPPRLDLLP
jgi:hypothetical protein